MAERRVTDSLVPLYPALEQTMNQLESLYDREGDIVGTATGFHDLDSILLGLHPSTLTIVAARPGQGKSSLALGIAQHVALHGRKPVLFFSMEMGYLELTKRLLAAEARVPSRKLQTGKLSEHEWPRVNQAVGRLAEAPFFIDDNPHCTVMEMRAKARRIKARYGDLGLIVVDYLQLMTTHAKRVESRQVEVSELSRGLKILARELESPVMHVVAAQPPARIPPRQAADARRPARVGLLHCRHPHHPRRTAPPRRWASCTRPTRATSKC